MSPRSIRRAAEHKANKLARKAGLHQVSESVTATSPSQPIHTPEEIPEPGYPFPQLSEISPARIAANRQNALLSTGPSSEAGKAVSSQNRTTHGLARHNGPFMLLPSEDQADFDRLLTALNDEHQPASETESLLVSDMAESRWLRNRAQRLQSTCFDATTGLIADQKSFALYLRYETTHQRAFHQSLRELHRTRAEARQTQIGFEAQRVKNEQHQMKKETHYWHVLRQDAEACHQIGRNSLQILDGIGQHPGFLAQFEGDLQKHDLKRGRFQVAVGA